MNVFIVGAGKVGYYLVKTLLPNKHRITIIEKSQNTATSWRLTWKSRCCMATELT